MELEDLQKPMEFYGTRMEADRLYEVFSCIQCPTYLLPETMAKMSWSVRLLEIYSVRLLEYILKERAYKSCIPM